MVRTPARLDSMFTKSEDMKFKKIFAENIQYGYKKNVLLILSSLKRLQAVSTKKVIIGIKEHTVKNFFGDFSQPQPGCH
jgi:hypothetical protein